MDANKKALLIALVLGDGYIYRHKRINSKGIHYRYGLEITHSETQKEYIQWKADICKTLTERDCKLYKKYVPERLCKGRLIKSIYTYRFSCGHRYFKILRHWLYPNDKKRFMYKYLQYLNPMGIAIWYMDDGSTYIDPRYNNQMSCELHTYTSLEESLDIIRYFQNYWHIDFRLHQQSNGLYTVRCFNYNALNFIQLIKPFVPQCMQYKVKLAPDYLHEHVTSYKEE